MNWFHYPINWLNDTTYRTEYIIHIVLIVILIMGVICHLIYDLLKKGVLYENSNSNSISNRSEVEM